MQYDRQTYRIAGSGRFGAYALAVGLIGLALCAYGWISDAPRFYHAWLTSFVYWVSLALAGLFFTMLHHLANARWSVVIRRVPENLAMFLPWLFIAFVPVHLGIHDLYHWSHEEALLHDAILQKKAAFLNVEFFTVRAMFYFAVWTIFALRLRRLSLRQDETGDPALTQRLRNTSTGGMLLFALTVTFAAFDWLMSLEPHWYSTIFGVYFFGGCFLGGLALITAILLALRWGGVLREEVTVEHYHDLGKLLFGFTIFWAYIGFAQYFLIWYGNIPEETHWFQMRWVESWKAIGYLLVFGHFALPFVVMLFRWVKRSTTALAVVSVWFLVMHWFDIYYLVYPTLLEQGARIGWLEIAATVGLGGVMLWLFGRYFGAHRVMPTGDPFVEASLKHVNF